MITIGVLGAGHLGAIHLKLLKSMKKVKLLGCYDHNEKRAAEVAAELGIPVFSSAKELIEKVQQDAETTYDDLCKIIPMPAAHN